MKLNFEKAVCDEQKIRDNWNKIEWDNDKKDKNMDKSCKDRSPINVD